MVVESKKFCALRYSSAVLRRRSLASAYLPACMSELASLCILTGSSLTFSVMSVHSQSAIFSGALTFRFSPSATEGMENFCARKKLYPLINRVKVQVNQEFFNGYRYLSEYSYSKKSNVQSGQKLNHTCSE